MCFQPFFDMREVRGQQLLLHSQLTSVELPQIYDQAPARVGGGRVARSGAAWCLCLQHATVLGSGLAAGRTLCPSPGILVSHVITTPFII